MIYKVKYGKHVYFFPFNLKVCLLHYAVGTFLLITTYKFTVTFKFTYNGLELFKTAKAFKTLVVLNV